MFLKFKIEALKLGMRLNKLWFDGRQAEAVGRSGQSDLRLQLLYSSTWIGLDPMQKVHGVMLMMM